MAFNVREADLQKLNSMTKYPSIPTYHALSNGLLTEEVVKFTGRVVGSEKIDGTNSRMIFLPDGNFLIGSREELLYCKGDLIGNPALGIVEALKETAHFLLPKLVSDDCVFVIYSEVYGGAITAASKRYTSTKQVGYRLFDIASIQNYEEVLAWPLEKIAAWRDAGGQKFFTTDVFYTWADDLGLPTAPILFDTLAEALPTSIAETYDFLKSLIVQTRVALDENAGGRAEGIVVRSHDRSVIAKIRYEDYERTLNKRVK